MSVPVLAISTAKRLFFLKWLAFQITIRSHTNFHTIRQLCFNSTTVICSVCLSRTSILALMPLFFRASIRRLAAMAGPPIFSVVFMSSILIILLFFDNSLIKVEILIGNYLTGVFFEHIISHTFFGKGVFSFRHSPFDSFCQAVSR